MKEWALVCDLLLSGEQVVLLRKGGIHEPRRGFAIEHEEFFLYPNAEHQDPSQVQVRFQDRLGARGPSAEETGVVPVPGFCRVTDVLQVPLEPDEALAALARLAPETCWTDALFQMRVRYKPERPLYVAVVRAYRIEEPVALPYHKVYAGCRSWVPLRDAVEDDAVQRAVPALSDEEFAQKRAAVLEALAS